ncbi:hypothetical protein ACP4OV_009061 [Aristida adscensionis]
MPPPPPPPPRWRRARALLRLVLRDTLVATACAAAILFLLLHGRRVEHSSSSSSTPHTRAVPDDLPASASFSSHATAAAEAEDAARVGGGGGACATVEAMGEEAAGAGSPEAASLRVRELIQRHFELHGAARVRRLPAHEFCKQGFVLGKASEAGFGNEMYKILTAAALSIMLNRSLIIGQTRGSYPFGQYISYTNQSFTIQEIKHLWRKHRCATAYGRYLNIRVDNFGNPYETNVLCSNWYSWKDPIIWFDGTTDAVGIQFFLKNVHPGMKASASALFRWPYSFHDRPNTFGELMRAIISPSRTIQEAVDWALKGADPDIALHMRMRTQRSYRARQAAVGCIKRALQIFPKKPRPRVALVSDTPSFIQEIMSDISEYAEVIYFDYKLFAKSSGLEMFGNETPWDFRSRDWGPAPRSVAFVDFFLASRARYAVVTGAHRRVGTTYAQLIAALAAARHGQDPSGTSFTFLSSFRSNLLVDGLSTQVGWGHIWNRYAGPLSCQHQPDQCALTPLLPPSWWDGRWQSPIPRDIRRLRQYGVRLSNKGEVDESRLLTYCRSRKDHVKIVGLEEMR